MVLQRWKKKNNLGHASSANIVSQRNALYVCRTRMPTFCSISFGGPLAQFQFPSSQKTFSDFLSFRTAVTGVILIIKRVLTQKEVSHPHSSTLSNSTSPPGSQCPLPHHFPLSLLFQGKAFQKTNLLLPKCCL